MTIESWSRQQWAWHQVERGAEELAAGCWPPSLVGPGHHCELHDIQSFIALIKPQVRETITHLMSYLTNREPYEERRMRGVIYSFIFDWLENSK